MGDFSTSSAIRGMASPTLEKVEEHDGEDSSGSLASSPEPDGLEQKTPQAHDPSQPPQKRKGGRKPVSASQVAMLGGELVPTM
jgi:hypothetical protein